DTPPIVDEDLALDDIDDVEDTDNTTFDILNEEVPGTDPDAVDLADDDAFHPEFPPDLDLDTVPEPIDGPPWSDADLLGDAGDSADTTWAAFNNTDSMNELFTMDGTSGGDWEALLASDDPAVSSLARWWQP
ncbi:MAG: hypothetical protein ACRD0P_29255, partial [Stackebrandtia sp.]